MRASCFFLLGPRRPGVVGKRAAHLSRPLYRRQVAREASKSSLLSHGASAGMGHADSGILLALEEQALSDSRENAKEDGALWTFLARIASSSSGPSRGAVCITRNNTADRLDSLFRKRSARDLAAA